MNSRPLFCFLSLSACLLMFALGAQAKAINYRALGDKSVKQPVLLQGHNDAGSVFADKNQAYYEYQQKTTQGMWADAGIGYGATSRFTGFAGGASLNMRSNNHLFTVQSQGVEGSNSLDAAALYTKMTDKHQYSKDLGLLYGKIHSSNTGYVSYSMGLAYAKGRSKDTDKTYTTFGIPLQTQAVWTPLPFLGIGAKLFSALNGNLQGSNVGAMMVISLGKFQ